MNVVNRIKKETTGRIDKPAVIDDNRKVTYGELFRAVDKIAIELKKLGVKPAERVALLYGDSIDYIVISLAVLSINAVIVPVFPSLASDEINAIMERIAINFLISEKEVPLRNNAKRVLFNYEGEKEIFMYKCRTAARIPAEFYALNPAFIRFSSGTTGVNKGVVLSHESIIQRTDAANRGLKITSQDTIIWVLSMTFHFVVTIFLFLRCGATIVLCSRTFPGALMDGLKRHRATFMYASPFHYYVLSHTSAFPSELLSNIRIAISTATKLPKVISDSFHEKFGFELSQAYGIIEVGLPFINFSQDRAKRGSVGKILPGYEIKIENADTEKIGEVCLRGKGMFDAYFSPWHSKKVFRNGWFNTGDLGGLDKDGFLFLSGRTNSVINYCGMKIFPSEVESIINQYPTIKESLVFGVPHPQYGQLPSAKVVLREGGEANLDSNEMRRFCYQHLTPHKVPKEFHCVSSLDKTLSGKLRRG